MDLSGQEHKKQRKGAAVNLFPAKNGTWTRKLISRLLCSLEQSLTLRETPAPVVVPLKTYQWEDLKRDKERGKYPYTYLSKNLLTDQDNTPENDKKLLVSAADEQPADGEQKKLADDVKKVAVHRTKDTHATIEETEHSGNKEEEMKSTVNERITMRQDRAIKYEPLLDDSLDKTESMSVRSKAESRNAESEDTCTEGNIEQYLDKEEILSSALDASELEAATSVEFVQTDITAAVRQTRTTLEVPQDHKRKHSGSSEGTKSNVSLFEKIKNTKFKLPTFEIPQFKFKLTLRKKGSNRVKYGSIKEKPTSTVAGKSGVILQRRTSESPVYIYIPLNPTAEDLVKERQEVMKSESHRRLADSPDTRTERRNESEDTNGTVSSASTSTNVNVPSTSSKWKGLQSKTDKKSQPVKKKSKVTCEKQAPAKSEKKTSPVTKEHDDSPVEYIYIPLKPPENETWHQPSSKADSSDQAEAVNTELISSQTQVPVVATNDETPVDKSVVIDEDIITDVRQVSDTQKPEIEVEQLPNVICKADEDKSKGAIKKKPRDKGKNIKEKTIKLTKDIKKLASKLKGEQTKTIREGAKKSSLKTAPQQASPTSKKRDDSPVEYIYIPLKGPVPDQNPEVKSSEKENLSIQTKTVEVTMAIVEKPSIMSKFKEHRSPPAIKKGFEQFTGKKVSPKSPEKETVDKKSSPPLPSVQRSDSPVEYIYIPLKPLESENSEALPKRTDTMAEGTQMEVQPSNGDPKLEIQQKPKEAIRKQVESKLTKQERVSDKPKDTEKDNIMTKLKGLKPKKAQAPKPDVKSKKEQATEKIKSPAKAVQSSHAPVEYIYIPLKLPASEKAESQTKEIMHTEESELMKVENVEAATVSEIVAQSSSLPLEEPKRRMIEDNTEEARLIKEAVIKKWQGFKTKPLQKPMPLRRTEPKISSPRTEKKSTSVVIGRGDSPVEYIYIPLNPTEEQLEYERELKEQKRLAARTPGRSAVAEDRFKKAAVQTGAIKKQPAEKGNKIKDTTTKLTEDIKKFASKLKDMQKKSKKPAFKTFKHGSKSSRMSPTTSKKPIDTRSAPIPRQSEDSPVEYIYIPLKGPETTEEPVKETARDTQEAAAISIPSKVVEKLEEPIKKPSTSEELHYELLTKEDEEDGLKTAIDASLKEMKASDEVLKAEDSPKLNRKLSIKMEELENGLDKSQSGAENAIHEETIQTKGEQPDTDVSAARKLVTVPSMAVDEQMIKDASLEDDHNKWSKSTLLAVC